MPELASRATLEQRLARDLGKLNRELADEFTAALGDPPSLDNVPPDKWDEMRTRVQGVLLGALTAMYIAAAEAQMEESGFTVDTVEVNEAAAIWARTYAASLATRFIDNTRKMTQTGIDDLLHNGLSQRDFDARIDAAFGPVRTTQIAGTETTSAISQGGLLIGAAMLARGLALKPFWETEEDDRVCPICAPLNDTEITNGSYPPAHINCRCRVTWRVPE